MFLKSWDIWVSLKKSKKLFKAFTDSICTFKYMYYLIKPVSQTSIDSVFKWEVVSEEDTSILCHNEDKSEVMKMVSKFHLRWSGNQFDQHRIITPLSLESWTLMTNVSTVS